MGHNLERQIKPILERQSLPQFVHVQMMNADRYVNIKRDAVNKVDVAELPFKGGRFSLYIALPRAVDGITDLAQVFISQVLHKAVIEVKETGTVAAAATVVGVSLTSVQLPPTQAFTADHPFVYFLRDNQTGQILFQGKFSG
uniref:Serpin domain-containing protein n=1 Tax=Biomphalaria glabrata TaxID=6526 RepID=A0A2C9JSV9_BIOGL